MCLKEKFYSGQQRSDDRITKRFNERRWPDERQMTENNIEKIYKQWVLLANKHFPQNMLEERRLDNVQNFIQCTTCNHLFHIEPENCN